MKNKKSLKKFLLYIFLCINLMACGGSADRFDLPLDKSTKPQTLLQPLPTDLSRQAIRLHPASGKDSDWQIYRGWPHGEIHILVRDNNIWRELPFVGANSLARLILETSDALYLFTYDVERNMPSGRGIGGVIEGIDLWRVDRSSNHVNLAESGLSLGGLDNLLVAQENLGVLDVCAVDKCLRVSTGGVVESWGAGELIDYEIVEVVFGTQDAYALVRNKDDHVTGNHEYNKPTYKVLKLRQPSSKGLPWMQNVEPDCLPFRLKWGIEKASWSCARTATELAEVFRYDFNRTQKNGVGDIGLNNSEGRIAWSLVYVLNALISLDSRITPKLTAASDWQDMRVILDGALELVARQGTISPLGYSSRRYSKNRIPLLFALHLGRIAHLLARGDTLGHSSEEISRTLKVLKWS